MVNYVQPYMYTCHRVGTYFKLLLMTDDDMIDTDPYDDDDEAENLPTLYSNSQVTLQPFQAIDEQSTDQQTTISDLAILNNHLAVCEAVIPRANTIAALCMLSATVCKLIETRRKVKKLAFGSNNNSSSGRVFEVVE